jgi:branched-chain amino acid aminotransferase
LQGITRHFALEIGDDLFEVVKRDISYAELAEADEAFITSTTKDLMPIVKVDEIVIGSGRPGPHTLRLLEAFRAFAYAQRMPI